MHQRGALLGAAELSYAGYQCLRVQVERGVAFVTIDHPPVNLLDLALIQELDGIGREVEADDDVRVLVLASADREFFIAHADVGEEDRRKIVCTNAARFWGLQS